MSYRTMKLELMSFVPELNAIQVGLRINRSYQHLLALHPWSFIKGDTLLKLLAPYTTGTVTATYGSASVTGAGTTFTSAHIGYNLMVQSAMVYYKVTNVVAGVLTIEATYGEATVTGAYRLFKNQYSVPTDCANIIAIRYDSNLVRTTKTWLDSLDPVRESTGEPYSWIPITNNTFEIWPVPDQNYTIRVWYNRSFPDMALETDTCAIPESVVLAHAKLEACMQMATSPGTDPNVAKQYLQVYTTLTQDPGPASFKALWAAAVEEDTRKISLPRTVLAVDYDAVPQDNEYWMTHDVMDPRRP
jgi:hypothetical protein